MERFEPATVDCNAPYPPQLIGARGGGYEVAPPAPDAMAFESMGGALATTENVHSLLAIDPQQDPYKVVVPEHCVPSGQEFASVLRICVDTEGDVSGMTILRTSLPIIDSQLPYVIARWQYEPYVVDGQAIAFCYPLSYVVR